MANQQTSNTQPASNNNKTLKIVLIIIGAVIAAGVLFSFLFGWGVASVFKRAAKDAGVDVSSSNGQVTIEDEEGQSTVAVGDDVELPEGFPSDVPIYEPSTITYAAKNQEDSYSASLQTGDSTQQVSDFYKTQLNENGWSSKSQVNTGGGQSKTYQKGERTLSVVISQDNSDNQTTVTLTIVSSN